MICRAFSSFQFSFLADENYAQCEHGDEDRDNCNQIADDNENTQSVELADNQDDLEDYKIRGDKLMINSGLVIKAIQSYEEIKMIIDPIHR